jgi:hypothetical protein
MSRFFAALLAAVFALNGLAMLLASFAWYNTVPGVTATGAYNPHFVRDIGAIYLVCAGAAAWFVWRRGQGWPALAAASAFLVLHAGVHVFDASCSPDPVAGVITDLPGIYAPTAIMLALVLFNRPRAGGGHA